MNIAKYYENRGKGVSVSPTLMKLQRKENNSINFSLRVVIAQQVRLLSKLGSV
jgi:hypothetical protein